MDVPWWNAQFCLVASLHDQDHIVHIFFCDLFLFIFRCQGPLYINTHSGIDSLSLWWYIQEYGHDTSKFHWWSALGWLSGWLLVNNDVKNTLDFIDGHYLKNISFSMVGILMESTVTFITILRAVVEHLTRSNLKKDIILQLQGRQHLLVTMSHI